LAAGDLERKQPVQAPEQHRVDVEEVARQDALGLCGQELPPGQPRTARRRLDAGLLEEQPHGARGHPIPKPHEFTVDASISPVGFSAAIRRIRRRSTGDLAVDGVGGGDASSGD
jgi:hypothetical protein